MRLLEQDVDVEETDGHNFEDIKSVSSSGFAADTVLDRKKQIFNEGVEFNITGGNTLVSGAIADFRSQ